MYAPPVSVGDLGEQALKHRKPL